VHTYDYDVKEKRLTEGPSYSYDSMLSQGINPYSRLVDVPTGHRVWVVTYDGMWGGFWSVNVYVPPGDLPASVPQTVYEPGKFRQDYAQIKSQLDSMKRVRTQLGEHVEPTRRIGKEWSSKCEPCLSRS
jgi:hypothetical protein